MKFELGQWFLLPGVEAIYPRTITNVFTQDDALIVQGYNHDVHGRSSFIHGTLFTVRFSSPMPNVVRVQLWHHRGHKPRTPEFDLDYSLKNQEAVVSFADDHTQFTTGDLSVRVPAIGAKWQFEVLKDNQPLTASEDKGIGLFSKDDKTYIRDQLSLGVNETIYGLGERFGAFVKNGQSVDIWNNDAGTMSEFGYKNVPFYLSSKGYGVLVNHPGHVAFEVASHHVTRVQFSVEGHSLDYYLFAGDSMKDTLTLYTALSGRPPKLPDWSYNLWLTTSFTTNYNEADIMANIERMEAEGIPIGVFHFDCFWMRELTWTSFIWDKRNFPDPAGLIKRIKDKGIKVSIWINPYIAEASPLFDEAAQNGYLVKTAEGDVKQLDHWQPGIGFVDFTNPAACDWYRSKLKELIDIGVDTFKTDFGEHIPTDVVYHDGSNPERMHNYYSYLYNQTVFNLLVEEKGEGEAVLFARAATAGGQQFPVHWGGDNSSSYPSMAETLRGGLSLGLCGFGYWSHDISGFNDKASADLYKRWVAFGLLSSHSRLHGASSARMPWLFDDESVDVLRFFNNLKGQLMPYLLTVAAEAQTRGLPMLRAMLLEFPEDPTCQYLDTQYMLGDSLLVAPIFSETGTVTYYLPAGNWRNLLTNETTSGGGWRTETHDYFSLPLWVNLDQAGQEIKDLTIQR